MLFEHKQEISPDEVLRYLGYGGTTPDARTLQNITEASESVERLSTPRWNYARFRLDNDMTLNPVGLTLPGQDIAAHLEGCHACYLLSLTLGIGMEHAIRAAEATDMPRAVLMDACASVLVEDYAAQAQETLRKAAAAKALFLTERFSPGYGDFPLSLQPDFLRLTDASRRIGLTTNENYILIPRKSMTAILGIADRPVAGRLAGCSHCPLREKCRYPHTGQGALCGKSKD